MTDIAKIAAGLTKAQRAMIRTGYGSHDTMMSPEIDPLWYAVTKLEQGSFQISLTPLGLAVRAHIQENGDGA